MRPGIWFAAWGFVFAGLIEPAWQWILDSILDKATSNPGWIVGGISGALKMLAPFEPYLIGIGIGLLFAAAIGTFTPIIRGSKAASVKKREPQQIDYRSLGVQALSLAECIGDWLHNPFLYNDYTTYTSNIFAMFVSFEKAGLRIPAVKADERVDRKMEMARRYLVIVGNLLIGGHTVEAKATAERVCHEIAIGNPNVAPRELQGIESEMWH